MRIQSAIKTSFFVLIVFSLISCGPPSPAQIKEWEELKQVDFLISSLKYPQLRWRIAESLGVIGDLKAVDPLIALLKDEDYLVRFHAVQALGKIKDEKAIEPLIQLLDDDQVTIRDAAKKIIEDFGNLSALPLAKALLDKNKALHQPVLEILSKLDDKAIYPLSLLLEGTDKNSKLIAINAFRTLKPPQAASILMKSLKDTDADVKAQAAAALTEIRKFQIKAAIASGSGENMGEDSILFSISEEESVIESFDTDDTPAEIED